MINARDAPSVSALRAGHSSPVWSGSVTGRAAVNVGRLAGGKPPSSPIRSRIGLTEGAIDVSVLHPRVNARLTILSGDPARPAMKARLLRQARRASTPGGLIVTRLPRWRGARAQHSDPLRGLCRVSRTRV